MRRPQIESRSQRYAARQGVADYEVQEGSEMSDGVKAEPVVVRSAGTVKFFDLDKGYGFCKQDSGAPDVFLHANELKRSGVLGGVKTGDRLEFDLLPVDGKGPKASRIAVLARAEPSK